MERNLVLTMLGCSVAVVLVILGFEHHLGTGTGAGAGAEAGVAAGVVKLQANPATRVVLTLPQTLLSGTVMLFAAGISWVMGLGLTNMLLVAYARTAVQLALLGLFLTPILLSNSLLVVLLVMTLMVFIASMEVKARMLFSYEGLTGVIAMALGVGVGLNMIMCLYFVQPDPIWSPIYSIPMWGMTLGNALSAVTLGTGNVLEGLAGGELKNVETILCHGGTRWEAMRPLISEALRKGLIPCINQMNVIGLVYLPGMMTGQLLGGSSATQACYYQMLIMFMIASSTACSLFLSLMGSCYMLSDDKHRILSHLLTQKAQGGDPLSRLFETVKSCFVSLGTFPFFLVLSLSVSVVSLFFQMLGIFPELPLTHIITFSLLAAVVIAPLMLVFALRKRGRESAEEDPLLG